MKSRVILTGDRNWVEVEPVFDVLLELYERNPDCIIVHGDCRGLDKIGGIVAAEIFGPDRVEAHPANWTLHGRSAGPIRNRFMLKESLRRAQVDGYRVIGGIAFHHDLAHSTGTKDMVSVLESAGYPVRKIR